jgi:UPF0176 protein|tara:strand:- start:1438 stop:2478 length:1041 start_codon:yes stop_codon:yes gene_type:complete
MKQKTPILFNKVGRDILKKELAAEPFDRITASFYAYHPIENPQAVRDQLFITWNKLNILGRIYIATEGINAQLSAPEQNWSEFCETMNSFPFLRNVPIKKAIQEGNSFYKLTIKVRKELVAYGVPENSYDMNKVGNHLSAEEFNQALEKPETIVVDMRNYYESEVGRFESAVIPDVEISKELLPEVKHILDGKEEEQILLYCTGGIRCEKASSYLMNHGFKNVNQLSGGIIKYAHEIDKKGLKSKFIGKNFVFDDRLGERVTEDVIAKCHICGNACDDHTDCNNDACHILFIQCETCFKELDGCCSKECNDFIQLPIEEQKIRRKDPAQVVSRTFFDSRIKPKLNQ